LIPVESTAAPVKGVAEFRLAEQTVPDGAIFFHDSAQSLSKTEPIRGLNKRS